MNTENIPIKHGNRTPGLRGSTSLATTQCMPFNGGAGVDRFPVRKGSIRRSIRFSACRRQQQKHRWRAAWMTEQTSASFRGVFSGIRQVGEAARADHGQESCWPGGAQKKRWFSSQVAYQEKSALPAEKYSIIAIALIGSGRSWLPRKAN